MRDQLTSRLKLAPVLALTMLFVACTPAAAPVPTVAPTSVPKPAIAATSAPSAAPAASAVAPAASPVPAAAKPAASPVAAVQMPAALNPPVHIRVHLSGSTVQGAVNIAMDRGYYKELGLDVEGLNITGGGGATDLIPPLVQGQIEFATGAPNAGLWNAISRGLDVKLVIPLEVPVPGDRQSGLVVRKDLVDSGRYASPKDLKGMKVALSGMGSYSQWTMERILASGGLTGADVTYVQLPYPEMSVALANKAIDAAFEVEPYLTIPQEQGSSKTVGGIGEYAPGSIAASVMISPVFAKAQPEAAKRFVLATMRAVRDYYKAVNQNLGGRDDIFRILARDTSLKDLAMYEKLGLPVYAPNGEFNEAMITEFQDFLIKAGVQQQRVPTEQWFDRSYMDYALSVLGRY